MFTPIEWMALILIVVSAVKIITILVNPGAWNANVVKKVWANSNLAMIVSLILAAIVLYYLLQGGLTIVQILAVTLFVALLMAAGAAAYKKELIAMADKMLKDKAMIKKSWIYIIVWVVLLAWGVKVLLV